MIYYKTVAGSAAIEQTIEKSKFIGYIKSVETREEADSFISEIRSLHRSATHNVPAYVIGDKMQIQWASDDGEPSGTSGAPILHMLTAEDITNTVVVVTRYFGGIKLGTGGLVRAYTSTARLALESAGICEVKELDLLNFRLDYTYYGKIQNLEQSGGFKIADAKFEDAVDITLQTEVENTEQLINMLSEMTMGTCNVENVNVKKILGKTKV